MRYSKITLLIILITTSFISFSQDLLSDTLATKYYDATIEPDATWNSTSYDDSQWESVQGIHLFGYGDAFSVETEKVQSIYVRSFFTIDNKDNYDELIFQCDFDDGFVAYINGIEFARVNMGKFNSPTTFDQRTDRSHELEMTLPNFPVAGYYIDKEFIENNLIAGENVLSFEVHNDSIDGSDLGMYGILLDMTDVEYNIFAFSHRYKKCVALDSTTLPIIQIETDEYGIPAEKDQGSWVEVPATMGITTNNNAGYNYIDDHFNDHFGNISIRFRGESSASFPKRSYNIELLDDNMEDTSASLIGMPRESDWILQGPFADKSQIRNALFYELANKTGHWTPRVKWCELVINGEFVGLYNLIEKIARDSNRVDIARLRTEEISGNDLTGGYIFKFDKGTYKIQIVYPKEKNLQPEQEEYIRNFFAEYEDVLESNNGLDEEIGYKNYIDTESLIDYISVVELGKNCDSYLYSSYMHKDRADKDNRIVYGPIWDFDLSLGNSVWQEGFKTDGWQFDYSKNKMFKIKRLFEDPELVDAFETRWFELREQFFHTDSLLDRIDELTVELHDPLARNYEVWPFIDKGIFFPAYFTFTYDEEIDYIKNWLTERVDWIDNNIGDIHYDVTQYTDIDDKLYTENNDFSAKVYPNPIVDELYIDLNMPVAGNLKVELINIQGKVVSVIEDSYLSQGTYKIYWNKGNEQLHDGLYIINLLVDGESYQQEKAFIKN